MPETLSAPASHEMCIPPSMKVETPFARYAHLANTPRGGEITEKQANARNTLDSQYLQAKQNIQEQTKEKVSTVRPLWLSDIRSPAGLAHYIEQSDDRWMQALEQEIGLDSTWKILALTGAHTTVKILEVFVDILKIGEGVKEWANALSNEELRKWEKAWAIANGIGMDGLRALWIAGGVGSLGKVLKNVKPSENLTGMEPKMGDYMAFGNQRGAVGERLKPVTKTEIVDPLALTQILEKSPKEYGELLRFELTKLWDPTQNFEHIFRWIRQNEAPDLMKMVNENANRWLKDMLGNINNLVKYLEQYPDRARLRGWMKGSGKFDQEIWSGIWGIMEKMKTYRKKFWFVPSPENTRQLLELIERVKNIPN